MKYTKNIYRALIIASLFFVSAAKGGTNGMYIYITNNSSYDLLRGHNTLIPPRSREILIDRKLVRKGKRFVKHTFAGAGFSVYKANTNDSLGGASIRVSEPRKATLTYRLNSLSKNLKNLIDINFQEIRYRGKYPDLVITVSDKR